jgi:hypothetical protein
MAGAFERPATSRLARIWRLGIVAAFALWRALLAVGHVPVADALLALVFLVVASEFVFLIDDAGRQRQPTFASDKTGGRRSTRNVSANKNRSAQTRTAARCERTAATRRRRGLSPAVETKVAAGTPDARGAQP